MSRMTHKFDKMFHTFMFVFYIKFVYVMVDANGMHVSLYIQLEPVYPKYLNVFSSKDMPSF